MSTRSASADFLLSFACCARLMLISLLSLAQAPPAACITAINTQTGLVTGKINARSKARQAAVEMLGEAVANALVNENPMAIVAGQPLPGV
jgi:hypothetical protein